MKTSTNQQQVRTLLSDTAYALESALTLTAILLTFLIPVSFIAATVNCLHIVSSH